LSDSCFIQLLGRRLFCAMLKARLTEPAGLSDV